MASAMTAVGATVAADHPTPIMNAAWPRRGWRQWTPSTSVPCPGQSVFHRRYLRGVELRARRRA